MRELSQAQGGSNRFNSSADDGCSHRSLIQRAEIFSGVLERVLQQLYCASGRARNGLMIHRVLFWSIPRRE